MALQNAVRSWAPWRRNNQKMVDAAPMTMELIQQVLALHTGLSAETLAGCTYTRVNESKFLDCKAEIEIFDPESKLIARGRVFGSQAPVFWRV